MGRRSPTTIPASGNGVRPTAGAIMPGRIVEEANGHDVTDPAGPLVGGQNSTRGQARQGMIATTKVIAKCHQDRPDG